MEQAPKNDEYNAKKVRNEMALLPDVTYEDRFMNIGMEKLLELLTLKKYFNSSSTAMAGHEWTNTSRIDQKYPDLRKHLACRIDTDNVIFRYPKPVERPLTWASIKGFNKPQ